MAVKSKYQGDKLILEIDNGDLTKMKEVLRDWDFKNEQSFWRFSLSILLEAQDRELWIKSNDEVVQIKPVDSLLAMLEK
jgi:predicted component of type VI protein secretion system